MNDHDRSLAIYRWVDDLRRTRSQADLTDELKARFDTEPEMEIRRTLAFLIANELRSQGRYEESERYYLDLARQFPYDPIPVICLAEQKLHYEGELDEALAMSRHAVHIAFQTGNFRRQALGVQARIAQKLKDYPLVEQSLQSIMSLEIGTDQMDCTIERDFFDSLPVGAINDSLAQRYDRFAQGHED
jgi:uncharacterized protein HemY